MRPDARLSQPRARAMATQTTCMRAGDSRVTRRPNATGQVQELWREGFRAIMEFLPRSL
jgi:hypothetical protein